ncbi:MAG: recombinase family protein, partial [Planctomycetota bacterium]|nr:recombinase family protein [Planctomycetota bacterium]
YAASHGIKVVQEFVDIETAKQAGRTQFDLMVRFLRRDPPGTIVLVEKTDRLYRNFRDYVTLDDLGLEIHLVKEGEVLSKDSRSHQKFIHGIKVLMAKNFIDNLSEEVKKGMAEKVAQGDFPHQAPMGYINDKLKHTIVVDMDRAPFVRKMFEWYSTGEYSLKDIRKRAVAAGIRPNGPGMCPISKSLVEWTLKNPFYTGHFRWKGGLYPGNHEPVISQQLFEKVQAVFKSHELRRGKQKVRRFAFGGLMTCGKCGCSIVGELKKKRYIYYHCTNGRRNCDRKYIREEALEGQFADLVSRVVIDAEMAEWIKEALRESLEEETAFHRQEIARITKGIEKVKSRLNQAYLDKVDGNITEEFWAERSSEWQQEQSRLMAEMERLQAADGQYLDDGVRIIELSQRAQELYLTQPPAEKRKLLGLLLSNCTLKDDRIEATYRQPFDTLALMAAEPLPATGDDDEVVAVSKRWHARQDSNLRHSD